MTLSEKDYYSFGGLYLFLHFFPFSLITILFSKKEKEIIPSSVCSKGNTDSLFEIDSHFLIILIGLRPCFSHFNVEVRRQYVYLWIHAIDHVTFSAREWDHRVLRKLDLDRFE